MTEKLRFTRGLSVSDHATERYIERVAPALSFMKARRQLERLVKYEGVVLEDRPEWVRFPPPDAVFEQRPVDAYISLGVDTGIVAVVQHRTVVTVLIRSGMSDEGRARRNARKQKRRAARREAAAMRSWLGSSKPLWR